MSLLGHLRQLFKEKSQKILSGTMVVMALGLAFIGGVVFQQDQPTNRTPLVINIPDYEAKKDQLKQEANQGDEDRVPPKTPSARPESGTNSLPIGTLTGQELPDNCPYVGSKNSNKYHLASCGVAKRIKSENRRCFASPEIAQASGYLPGCVQ